MAIVLVAEDESTSCRLLLTGVERAGHTAIVSRNGRHAWETLDCNRDIRLLITDVMMPELDGRDLVKRVRSDTELRELPIIIVSAFVGPKEINNLLLEGATWFLGKPLDLGVLGEYIQRAMEVYQVKPAKGPTLL